MIFIKDVVITNKIDETDRLVVYLGFREEDRKPVVLKISKRKSNLEHEYKILDFLHGQGTVLPSSFEEREEEAILILEDGGVSFNKLLFKKGVTLLEKVQYMLDAVSALEEIHHQKIIHHDLRPRSFVVNKENNITKIVNFGVANVLHGKNVEVLAPNYIENKKTIKYAPPEALIQSENLVDYRSDYYSLGVIFYEMLVGDIPFFEENALKFIHFKISKTPKSPFEIDSTIPKILSDIVMTLLQQKPEDRYQSLEGLKKDLKKVLFEIKNGKENFSFPLSKRESSGALQFPLQPLGYIKERRDILGMIQRSIQEESEILFLTGPPGIGKTKLISSLKEAMYDVDGYFVKGHFEKRTEQVPYSGIIEVFESFIQQILMETPEKYETWKEILGQALFPNAQVLIELFPSLEKILGPQPPLLDLNPLGARNRFNVAFYNFMNAITTPEHPLMIFLDNSQWMDSASLKLFNILLPRIHRQSFFLVFSYEPLPEKHFLMDFIEGVKKMGFKTSFLELEGLQEKDISLLFSKVFSLEEKELQELTKDFFDKTKGNPLFIKDLTIECYQKEMIFFDNIEKRWRWKLSEIQSKKVPEDLSQWIVEKFLKLPEALQLDLKWGALIGNEFDLFSLEKLTGQDRETIKNNLSIAVEEGYIFLANENFDKNIEYQFSNLNVKDVIEKTIEPSDRASMYLAIGRLFSTEGESHQHSNNIFNLAYYFNQGVLKITGLNEKKKLAEINLEAGKNARKWIANKIGLDFFKKGIELLGEEGWEHSYDLTLSLYTFAMEAAYLNMDYEEMKEYEKIILMKAKNSLDKVKVYLLISTFHTSQRNYKEALEKGLEGIRALGFNFNTKANFLRVLWWMLRLNLKLYRKGKEDLIKMPIATDPRISPALLILDELGVPAYFTDLNLLALLTFRAISEINFKYGATPELSMNYMAYAVMLCSVLKKPKKGYEYGQLALELAENFKSEQLKARLYFLYYGYVFHWNAPLEESLEKLKESFQIGLEVGDFVYAGFSVSNYIGGLFCVGGALSFLEEEAENYLKLLDKINQKAAREQVNIFLKLSLYLQGKIKKETEEIDFLYADEKWNKEKNIESTVLQTFFFSKLLANYFSSDFKTAYEQTPSLKYHTRRSRGFLREGPAYFFMGLVALEYYGLSEPKKRKSVKALIKFCIKKMKFWSLQVPSNYHHRYYLLLGQGELTYGDEAKGVGYLEKGIFLAKKNRYRHEEAIGNELLGKFYFSKKQEKLAKFYIQDALTKYQRWNAEIKVLELKEKYDDLLRSENSAPTISLVPQGGTTFSSSADIDLSMITGFLRTISEEIVLENLLGKLINIFIENFNAEKSCLLLEKNNHWYIEAQGEVGKESVILKSLPLEGWLPISVIEETILDRNPLVFYNAEEDLKFSKDPYIQKNRTKSIAALPLLSHGVLKGILYLENNAIENAFTEDQLALLNLLSSQIIISIDNARLYTDAADLNKNLSILNETLIKTKEAYSHFVPEQLFGLLNRKNVTEVKLGDHAKKEMTVLFSDIRGFIPMLESLGSEESVSLINRVISYYQPEVTSHHGFIDKYMGDGMMALFPTNADDAVQGSIGVVKRVRALNEELFKEGKQPIVMGLGLNSGSLMLGTVGGKTRMDCTVVSDVVNAGARIQGLTRNYRVPLLISEETYKRLKNPNAYHIRKIWFGSLRGKLETITVYEIFDGDPKERQELKEETKVDFEKGVEEVRLENWKGALEAFQKVFLKDPEDSATLFYINFCKEKLF